MGEWYLTLISNWCHSFDKKKDILGAGIRASYNSMFGPLSAEVHWSSLTRGAGFYFSFGFNF